MHRSLFLGLAFFLVACGGGSTKTSLPDFTTGPQDLSASPSPDLAMAPVTPYNDPGNVFCYGTLTCSTTGAAPVCCDEKGDGGSYTDTCVANAAACSGMDSTTYACGQAADCGTGMVCCGTIGTSSSGKPYFSGTTCEASCGSGETQLCVTAGECTSGTSCTGQEISGRKVGLCQ